MNKEAENQSEFKAQLSKLRHDIRTPVGHIIGYAEMIEEDLSSDLLRTFSGDLQAIQNAGHKMLALIEDFLGATTASPDEINVSEAQFQFRMQLNHITGYSEMIFEEANELGEDEFISDLENIAEAGRKALNLVDAIPQRLLEKNAEKKPAPKREGDSSTEKSTSIITSQIGQGGELLVVDDDPSNRELLRRRVKRMGYSARPWVAETR